MNDAQQETPRPQRAVRMELTIGADTRKAMADALEQLAWEIRADVINGPSGCSGSCDAGYAYDFVAGEHPTHEEYVESLKAYTEQP
jgi:hypothetical protein